MRSMFWMSLLTSTFALAAGEDPEPRRVAEAYIRATTGEGSEAGREQLLGGVSMDAGIFNLENGKIVRLDPIRRESGDLGSATRLVKMMDGSAKKAMSQAMNKGSGGDDLTVVELTKEEAEQLMKPTDNAAKKLNQVHPVLSYALRVGKKVYWHPKNPMRPVLAKAGGKGRYNIEVYRFVVASNEGPRQVPREWGLKVIRFKANGVDTQWKILPASDWDPE
jgi:hypothetical protein